MQPTKQLKEEHNSVKVLLQILEEISKKFESGQAVPAEHLDMVTEFIRVFIDKCHHGKEENILFPAMEEAGITRENSPIEVMLIEHASGRDYVKRLNQDIIKYKKSGLKDTSKIVKDARGYIALMTQHIDKEDTILYPLADKNLPAMVQGELMWRFEEMEEKVIGAGEHEKLNQAINSLVDTYL